MMLDSITSTKVNQEPSCYLHVINNNDAYISGILTS